ncbi:HD domain-containing protein [Cardinium endosymbiont of Sogatella furcifera]|uniref:HD domain-containing protein n=1 Tax=Cardinium endosymbiont of Sogatella furcifera TaxID=650378 RepID=UPI002937330C|nr:HD domain-containing protein [Cardinium endosymbiont of Sogatella furcifera]
MENKQKIADYKDVRVILVKLVDRLYNLKTADVYALEKQKRIVEETLIFTSHWDKWLSWVL